MANLPPGCTSRVQPLDVSCDKSIQWCCYTAVWEISWVNLAALHPVESSWLWKKESLSLSGLGIPGQALILIVI